MPDKDIRWIQRFSNFEKALGYLEQVISIKNPDIFQRAGMIQFFEMSFELSWNVIKDYLEDQGFIKVKTPRETIKKAFEIALIEDGHTWLSLLDDRNLMSHTFDEDIAVKVNKLIEERYYPLLKQLYDSFKLKL